MKASYNWLNDFTGGKLPEPEKLADLLTMHLNDVESVEQAGADSVIDLKTTPNLNHHCLSHRGIAREAAAILDIEARPYSRKFREYAESKTVGKIEVEIENPKLCRRYIGRVIENIAVGPSPEWLKTRLETLGQRSINNIVDATNFVMLEIGQPMHAFDADKLSSKKIAVKNALSGQKITTLDKKEIELDESVLLITDGKNPLAIAGVKGGNFAELDGKTKNIVLESANFDPILIRKTSQKVKIQTDASKRYENEITPELCGEAMEILTKLIVEVAGTKDTEVGAVADNYPRRGNPYKVGISAKEASDIIGVKISDREIEKIFNRLGFGYEKAKPIDEVLKLAPALLGAPYKRGASISYDAPKLFDCSSFIAYLFAQAGVQIPRICIDQYAWGSSVDKKDLQPGDVVFLNTGEIITTEGGNYSQVLGKMIPEESIRTETVEFLPGTKIPEGVDHELLYIGGGKVVNASLKENKVIVQDLAIHEKKIVGYRRMSDNAERYAVTIPAERLDLRIKEDLAEEIARIYGYEKVPDAASGKTAPAPVDRAFAAKERIRGLLYAEGFSEVMNYTFRAKGDRELANPASPEKKYLRADLAAGLSDCLEFNARYAELVEMPQIRIFEFGHVFSKGGESEHLAIGVKNPPGLKKPKEKDTLESIVKKIEGNLGAKLSKINKDEAVAEFVFGEIVEKLPEPERYEFPKIGSDVLFRKISPYPYIIRDIAVFTPAGTKPEAVFGIIEKEAGTLMVKSRLFDTFEKDGKISYAYRLVFQSYEKTLSDAEANAVMEKITADMNAQKGWQVR